LVHFELKSAQQHHKFICISCFNLAISDLVLSLIVKIISSRFYWTFQLESGMF